MHRLPVVVHLIAVGYGRNVGQSDPEGHDQDRQRRAPDTEDLLGVPGDPSERGRPARHICSRLLHPRPFGRPPKGDATQRQVGGGGGVVVAAGWGKAKNEKK